MGWGASAALDIELITRKCARWNWRAKSTAHGSCGVNVKAGEWCSSRALVRLLEVVAP